MDIAIEIRHLGSNPSSVFEAPEPEQVPLLPTPGVSNVREEVDSKLSLLHSNTADWRTQT